MRLLAAAVLLLVAAAPAAPGTAALLREYEPVTFLYRSDWKPVPVETLLAASDLERRSGAGWSVVRRSPSARSLPAGSTDYRLDVRGCSPARDTDACYRDPAASAPAAGTVYGRVWTNPDRGSRIRTVLQYWLFYYLDDWRNSLVRPTLWQIHEGDWETVAVALGAGGRPVEVAYSEHLAGVVRPWAAVARRGTHPVDYVALGSHANYFTSGRHLIPAGLGGPLPEHDFTAAQVSYGPAGLAMRPLRVVDVTAGTPWLRFAGAWGDGGYLLLVNPPRPAVAHLRTVDSPPGPAYHDLWRDPLSPFTSWPRGGVR